LDSYALYGALRSLHNGLGDSEQVAHWAALGAAPSREAELEDDGKEAIILVFPAESIRICGAGAAQRREFEVSSMHAAPIESVASRKLAVRAACGGRRYRAAESVLARDQPDDMATAVGAEQLHAGGRLRGIIQVTMGWEGIHLYQFCVRAVRYGSWELAASSPQVTLAQLRLRKGAQFTYEDDLNIPWLHEIRVEDRLPESGQARCCRAAPAAPVPGHPRITAVRRAISPAWTRAVSVEACEDLEAFTEILDGSFEIPSGSVMTRCVGASKMIERGEAREHAVLAARRQRAPARRCISKADALGKADILDPQLDEFGSPHAGFELSMTRRFLLS
jgi:hypothetical protein